MIAAFDDECRGFPYPVSSAEVSDNPLFFITLHSNDLTGKKVKFKYYNGKDFYTANESAYFNNNQILGSLDTPFELTLFGNECTKGIRDMQQTISGVALSNNQFFILIISDD